MRQGISRDLNQLRNIVLALQKNGSDKIPEAVTEALDVIQRLLSDFARQLDRAEHDAASAIGTVRRYGMR